MLFGLTKYSRMFTLTSPRNISGTTKMDFFPPRDRNFFPSCLNSAAVDAAAAAVDVAAAAAAAPEFGAVFMLIQSNE